MPTIWLTSDHHLDHQNIISFENRPFQNVEEMNETLISNWNNEVKEDDIVFSLGDMFFGKAAKSMQMAKRLNGRKHLILGNHDHFSKTKYRKMGFNPLTHYFFEDLLFTHYPQHNHALRIAKDLGFLNWNVHGHIHSKTENLDPYVHQCVCVELTDYRPISLEELRDRVRKN